VIIACESERGYDNVRDLVGFVEDLDGGCKGGEVCDRCV